MQRVICQKCGEEMKQDHNAGFGVWVCQNIECVAAGILMYLIPALGRKGDHNAKTGIAARR